MAKCEWALVQKYGTLFTDEQQYNAKLFSRLKITPSNEFMFALWILPISDLYWLFMFIFDCVFSKQCKHDLRN